MDARRIHWPSRIGPAPTPLALGLLALLILAVIVLALAAGSSGAPAAQGAHNGLAGVERADPFDGPGAAFDILLKLFAVVALIYLTLAALRRYTLGAGISRRNGQLQVLETASLAPNRTIVLVRVADRRLLLGVTQQQITTLAEWEEAAPAAPRAAEQTVLPFDAYLR